MKAVRLAHAPSVEGIRTGHRTIPPDLSMHLLGAHSPLRISGDPPTLAQHLAGRQDLDLEGLARAGFHGPQKSDSLADRTTPTASVNAPAHEKTRQSVSPRSRCNVDMTHTYLRPHRRTLFRTYKSLRRAPAPLSHQRRTPPRPAAQKISPWHCADPERTLPHRPPARLRNTPPHPQTNTAPQAFFDRTTARQVLSCIVRKFVLKSSPSDVHRLPSP